MPGRLTATKRNAWFEHATEAAAQIRVLAGTSRPWRPMPPGAASDMLHVAAMMGSTALRQAADANDRAARAEYGRIPTLSEWA